MIATLSLFCAARKAAGYPAGPPPMTITSYSEAIDILLLSDAEQQTCRVLETILDGDEELHRFPAIDDAVIVRDRDIHHGSYDHFAIDHHRALLGGMHAEYGA